MSGYVALQQIITVPGIDPTFSIKVVLLCHSSLHSFCFFPFVYGIQLFRCISLISFFGDFFPKQRVLWSSCNLPLTSSFGRKISIWSFWLQEQILQTYMFTASLFLIFLIFQFSKFYLALFNCLNYPPIVCTLYLNN
jgi:hypothetical protein